MKKYKKIPTAGSVMTPFPYSVDTDAGVTEVERLIKRHNIHHIPVQQEGRVVGIISEGELNRTIDRLLPNMDKARFRARDIMLEDPYVVPFEAPLSEVALEMAKRRTGSAIVVHHEKLAGILSATDICRLLAEILDAEFSGPTEDDAA